MKKNTIKYHECIVYSWVLLKYSQYCTSFTRLSNILETKMCDILQMTFSNAISSLKWCDQHCTYFFSNGPTDNKPTLDQILAWHQKKKHHCLNQWCHNLLHHLTSMRSRSYFEFKEPHLTLECLLIYCEYFSIKKLSTMYQGAVSIRKTVLPGMAIPMLKIRRPNGCLIFDMEIAIRR